MDRKSLESVVSIKVSMSNVVLTDEAKFTATVTSGKTGNSDSTLTFTHRLSDVNK